jgi:hypothetical protein
MSAEYTEYLAANVLNEQQLVRPSHTHPMSRESNTLPGQLSLAEQGIEGACQPGKAV